MNDRSDRSYFRPVPCAPTMPGASRLAGGPAAFREIEVMRRGDVPQVVPIEAVLAIYPESAEVLDRLTRPRAPIAGLSLDRPRVMAVVNVTPDSFSDGGLFRSVDKATGHALSMVDAGADILDIGGESTRPGAATIVEQEELDRVLPVIERLVASGCPVPLSIDTRKAAVAEAAIAAGAVIYNDVSALTYDDQSASVARQAAGVCLMHAQGEPETMQNDPRYDDVLLDIYDFLEERLEAALALGVSSDHVLLDPGIGFGKTTAHNVTLVAKLSLFHGLGCGVLLGASRKGFIGRIAGEADARRRVTGSVVAGLAGVAQGAHVLRVHDVGETVQALRVWQAFAEEA